MKPIRKEGSFFEIFKPGIRLALFIAVGLGIFQQFTGASIMFAYAPSVFQKAGFTQASDAIGQTVILQIWNVVMTVLAMICVDRFGRRPLLMIGAAGMALGLAGTGLAFQTGATGYLVLAFLFLAIGSYVLSIAGLAWVIMAEIFPNHVRGKAMSVGALVVWTSCYLAIQTFAPMRDWFQNPYGSIGGAFMIYAAMSVLSLIFCWRFVLETKGKTLEEIGRGWTDTGNQS
jgi:SP family arabinose:H+ symporter-like MFS transporter